MIAFTLFLKNGWFSIERFQGLPEASFFFNLSAKTYNSFPKSTGVLNLFFCLISWFLLKLLLLSTSFRTSPNLRKSYFSLSFSLSKVFCSSYSGDTPYLTDLVLFKLLVSFLMRWSYVYIQVSLKSYILTALFFIRFSSIKLMSLLVFKVRSDFMPGSRVPKT